MRETRSDARADMRHGGWAMIAGTMMSLVTMALHPTGQDVLRAPGTQGPLALAVHALAIVAVPVALYGALQLTRCLARGGAFAELALCFSALGGMATLLAATASGFLAPELMANLTTDDGATTRALLRYNTSLNQAFARILVGTSSIAILLWSIDILRTRLLARTTAIYGCAASATILILLLTGNLPLDVHRFGAVILAQSLWLLLTGTQLSRHDPNPRTTPHSPLPTPH